VSARATSSAKRAPTVVLVDEQRLYRAGLRELLESDGIRVVGEGSSANACTSLIERLDPDVAVIDPALAGGAGRGQIRSVRQRAARTRVLVLADSLDRSDVIDAVLTGAHGYIVKEASAIEIVEAVRNAAAGGTPIAPRVGGLIFDELRRRTHGGPPQEFDLSAREKEVLALVVEGKTNSAIARELVISPHTVRTHLSNILSKLHASTRVQAAVQAVRHSLV